VMPPATSPAAEPGRGWRRLDRRRTRRPSELRSALRRRRSACACRSFVTRFPRRAVCGIRSRPGRSCCSPSFICLARPPLLGCDETMATRPTDAWQRGIDGRASKPLGFVHGRGIGPLRSTLAASTPAVLSSASSCLNGRSARPRKHGPHSPPGRRPGDRSVVPATSGGDGSIVYRGVDMPSDDRGTRRKDRRWQRPAGGRARVLFGRAGRGSALNGSRMQRHRWIHP